MYAKDDSKGTVSQTVTSPVTHDEAEQKRKDDAFNTNLIEEIYEILYSDYENRNHIKSPKKYTF